MSERVNFAVSGVAGRMGAAIVRAIARHPRGGLAQAVECGGSAALRRDAGVVAGSGECNVMVAEALSADEAAFAVLLEFTTPAATLAHLADCVRMRRAMVIGTTGLDASAHETIAEAARKIPIVVAANTSVGVNVCAALLEMAGKALADADIEVIEAHHRHKVDAPSGTALLLAQAAAPDKDLTKDGVFARHGHTGERPHGAIGFSTIRGGDLAGEHSVLFISDGERVEITHKATSREIFADGAIRAGLWLSEQPAGLYGMRDVLGI